MLGKKLQRKGAGCMEDEENKKKYEWWNDPDLWTEDDGEDLPDRELTKEELERLEKIFNTRLPD